MSASPFVATNARAIRELTSGHLELIITLSLSCTESYVVLSSGWGFLLKFMYTLTGVIHENPLCKGLWWSRRTDPASTMLNTATHPDFEFPNEAFGGLRI